MIIHTENQNYTYRSDGMKYLHTGFPYTPPPFGSNNTLEVAAVKEDGETILVFKGEVNRG